MNSVRQEVFDIIAKQARVEPATVTLGSTLQSLNVESLAALEILFEIEDHFGISLPEGEAAFDLATVEGLVTAVERLVAQKNP